jgi:hypothetical protein
MIFRYGFFVKLLTTKKKKKKLIYFLNIKRLGRLVIYLIFDLKIVRKMAKQTRKLCLTGMHLVQAKAGVCTISCPTTYY